MNDKELADKVVALGVGLKFDIGDGLYTMEPEGVTYTGMPGTSADKFLTIWAWQIAGALMEKVPEIITIPDHDFACIVGRRNTVYDNSSLSRAIIEACVEALKGETE